MWPLFWLFHTEFKFFPDYKLLEWDPESAIWLEYTQLNPGAWSKKRGWWRVDAISKFLKNTSVRSLLVSHRPHFSPWSFCFFLYDKFVRVISSHVSCTCCMVVAEQIITRCAAPAAAKDLLWPGRDFSFCQMLVPPHVREKPKRCWQLPALRWGADQGLGAVSGRRWGLGPSVCIPTLERTSWTMFPFCLALGD